MKNNKLLFFLPAFLLLLFACHSKKYSAGEIYSIDMGMPQFSICKIIGGNDRLVYLLVYPARFNSRPASSEITGLPLLDEGNFESAGIAVIPLEKETFIEWEPELLGQKALSDYEKKLSEKYDSVQSR